MCFYVPVSIQAVDVEAVAVTVKELVSYALTLNPNNQSWLITQADIYFGKKHHTHFQVRRAPRSHLRSEIMSRVTCEIILHL